MRFIYAFVDVDQNHNYIDFSGLERFDNISYEILLMADFYSDKRIFHSLIRIIPLRLVAKNQLFDTKPIFCTVPLGKCRQFVKTF